jgi:hypothetical protein
VCVDLQAPIQLYGLEGRYATAIYTAAAKKNQLDAVDKDFQGLLVYTRLFILILILILRV